MEAHYYSCAQTRVAPYVTAMWQVQGMPAHQQETILPKGIIELIFSFADPLQLRLNPEAEAQTTPACFISGLTTKPMQLQAPPAQALFGVQLTPLAVRRLLKVPAGAFLNSLIDVRLLNPSFETLANQLAEAATFLRRCVLLEAWVQQRLQQVPAQEAVLSAYLSGASVAAGSVAELADRVCYSPRQLSRKAHELFGLSAEALLRYRRYVGALPALHAPGKSLTSVGLENGFYDQAHFVRDFRHFTGLTPSHYRQQLSERPGHLFR
ncbi:hypothetical protein PK28_12405 [Hymenobacter sp. DG25B]|uniref:helix-turn-helix domain-containing protein n=1 Tax=Hymenobacter sp. DG25B TaxID=1385664 RepID=UPI000540AF24|nr:helix-turn-helix domain-containing protein [Hymenobacter sp. DG25B]AIZ64285.1 hypothetical protein PK28_12405 [Hymenobacter sp. DG25B]